jgi:hypothetical protein
MFTIQPTHGPAFQTKFLYAGNGPVGTGPTVAGVWYLSNSGAMVFLESGRLGPNSISYAA